MTTPLPSWALSHLEKHLPAGNPVVNAQPVRRNAVLANTRLGAVLVERGFFSGIRHVFLEVPSQKTAFRCAKCRENLQFYNLDIPNDVYCSICAAKYHVDHVGRVTDAMGVAVPAEFKPKQLHPFPPVWASLHGSRSEGEAGSDANAPRPAANGASPEGDAFRHNGYTLFARTTPSKTGSRTLYFFSKGTPKSGEPASLPQGYAVGSNGRTGLPFLRRSGGKAKSTRAPRTARAAKAAATGRAKALPQGRRKANRR